MKTKLCKLIVLSVVSLMVAVVSSCSKDTDKIDYSNIENLYAQPLPIIQKCVQGKWQIKALYGGFTGYYCVRDSIVFEISNDKIGNRDFQWEKYTEPRSNGSFLKTYMAKFVDADMFYSGLYFYRIRNDSLSVSYAGQHPCYDCYTGELWIRVD